MSNPQVTGTYRWLWTCTGVGQINTSGCGSGLGEGWGKYTLQTVSLDLERGRANTHFGPWLWTWSGAGQIHTLDCGSGLGEGQGKYTLQTMVLDLERGRANTHFRQWLWTWSEAGQIHTLGCGSGRGVGRGKYTLWDVALNLERGGANTQFRLTQVHRAISWILASHQPHRHTPSITFSVSGTFLQTLPEMITLLKGHSISAQMSTNAVGALSKVWVLTKLRKQQSIQECMQTWGLNTPGWKRVPSWWFSVALRPQRRVGLLGTGTEWEGGERVKGSTAETARKRPERPWTAARTMEVLRRCPLTIAQRLVHRAIALSTAVLDSVTKTISVAPLLMNNLDNSKQRRPNCSAQHHLPTHDLFWAKVRVQLDLPPLRSLDLLISPGTLSPFNVTMS